DFNEHKEIYSALSDSIAFLKSKIYDNTASKEAKFLFEKIEAKQMIFEKKHTRVYEILEQSLATTAGNQEDSIFCYSKLRQAYINLNYLNKAVEANIWHDKLVLRSNNPERKRDIFPKSRIYDLFGLYHQAIKERRNEFNKEYELRKNDTDFVVGFWNDIGVYYNRLRIGDSAIPYFRKASELISKKLAYSPKKDHYNFFKSLIEGNMALSFTFNGEYEKAIPYLKADCYNSLRVNDQMSAFNSYVVLARCYLETNKTRLAVLSADTAYSLSLKIRRPLTRLRMYELNAELNSKLGNFEKAATNYKKYIVLKDSLTKIEKELELLNQQVALEITSKDLELEEKNKMLQLSQVKEAKQNAFKAYMLAGIIILLLLITFLFYSNRITRKREDELVLKSQKIEEQNNLITSALQEKELLLKEVHHRVKNNLQIISSILNLQIDKMKEGEVKDLFKEIKLRINSIAITHQMLYQKGTVHRVNLKEYVTNLVSQIGQSIDDYSVNVSVDIEDDNFSLPIDAAIPLGLLLNEMLTNSYKHAFPEKKKGNIKIHSFTRGNQLMLEVSDDGVGMKEDTKSSQESLGLELIEILIDQLGAEMVRDVTNGTSYKMIIEIN
ncbi:MAG: histidine kinase dimerization/phosphoacceptor domain -containing protein, partial [Bacteroidia bacterium]